MNVTFFRALVLMVPASLLLLGSAVLFLRLNTLYAFMQLLGAGLMVTVALAHICEALHVFPYMGWGLANSVGHYVDLTCAVLGFTLFPVGYFLHTVVPQGKVPEMGLSANMP